MRIDIPGKEPIQFEGQTLSDTAKYFENIPGYHSFPEDVQRWILDLKYAWSRERKAESKLILQACDLLEDATLTHREELLSTFQSRFPDLNPSEFLQHWLQSISIIRSIAEARQVCCWTIQPLDAEIAFYVKPCVALIRKNQSAIGKRTFSEAFLNQIENGAKEVKLKFINDVVDAYSDRTQ